MCLIIASQNGALTDESIVRLGFADNPDSWGIMTSNGRRVITKKGFAWDDFEREYTRINGDPYVIHFRYATHGAIDLGNCHPFQVSSGLYMAHNGVINIKADNPAMSDSWHYAKLLRSSGITKGNIDAYIPEIGKEIGIGNKLAFLTSRGDIHIANQSSGVMNGSVWLSNPYSTWMLPTEYEGQGYEGYGQCEYCLTEDWITPLVFEGHERVLCDLCASWAERRESLGRVSCA